MLLVDRLGREFAAKAGQGLAHFRRARLAVQLGGELIEGRGTDLGDVQGDHVMQDLVDQAHGIQRSGPDRLSRRGGARLVQLLGKDAHRLEIGQHHVAREGEQGLVELAAVAAGAGNVEFHRRPSRRNARGAGGLQPGEAQSQAGRSVSPRAANGHVVNPLPGACHRPAA